LSATFHFLEETNTEGAEFPPETHILLYMLDVMINMDGDSQ